MSLELHGSQVKGAPRMPFTGCSSFVTLPVDASRMWILGTASAPISAVRTVKATRLPSGDHEM